MVKTIDIVCHTHTDFGYTDYPLKARELLKRYVGQAVEYAAEYAGYSEDAQFHWTMETLLPVWDWWQEAAEEEHQELLKAIKRGQIEVMGLPFNITAFLNEDEWDYMLRWIPKELWERLHICSAMQNDVNGLHTGGLSKAYDAGIRNIWIGPNTYNGVPPVPTPALAEWQLDESRRLRVWLNASYCDGYFLFQENWRQGPVPNSVDLRYRKPTPQDFFRSDEASVLKAHQRCLQNIADIEGTSAAGKSAVRDGFTQNKVFGGYRGEVLAVSLTNQWRIDNDPPVFWISDFVKTWNELGLKPQLQLRTAAQAIKDVEEGWGEEPIKLSGEWTDWWANGTAASPMELAYSRKAKRLWKIAKAPVFGPWTSDAKNCADEVMNQLCRYDEHTYGAWQSAAYPDSFETKSQRAEKDIFAYRALAAAEELLSQRAQPLEKGLWNSVKVINPAAQDRNFCIRLPYNCLRGEFTALKNQKTNQMIPIVLEKGTSNFMRPKSEEDFGEENISHTFCDSVPKQTVVFRVTIPAMTEETFLLCEETVECVQEEEPKISCMIEEDEKGWPKSVSVGAKKLVDGAMGDFSSLAADGFAPRWTFRDIFDTEDIQERRRLYQLYMHLSGAEYSETERQESGDELCFVQSFYHPSLTFGKRILTVNIRDLTASLTIRFYRKSNFTPEVYYIAIDSPVKKGRVHLSNVGKAFQPGLEQMPGSCKDYYAMDGWVHHEDDKESWMISSRDAALVVFGEPSQPSRRDKLSSDTHKMFFQVFDNTWDTNFHSNAFGLMEFTFDFAQGTALEDCAQTAQNLAAEPVVIVRTGY